MTRSAQKATASAIHGAVDIGSHLGFGLKVAAYVRSGGAVAGDSSAIASKLVTTLSLGLAQCRSGEGDVVVVMPGHAEDISTADQMSTLVAGTRIVGVGFGGQRPTFTWTAAAATFLFDVANVTIENCKLVMATADNAGVTVAAPITVSAADCGILGCDIRFGDDANDIVTIGITTTAAADGFTFSGNTCYSAIAAECTTFLRLVGTDRLVMKDNLITGATSSTTVGVLQMLTTAGTDAYIENCTFVNRKALSVHAATGMAAATGVVKDCAFHILDTATLAGWETEGDLAFHGCTTTNLAGEAGGVKVPTSTVT